MEPQVPKWFSESQRKAFAEGEAKGRAEAEAKGRAEAEAKGRAEGEAEGKAEALLQVLALGGIAVDATQQARIMGCRDLPTLNRWLECMLSVSSVDDLLG